jgi:hypothetical protein
MDIEYEALLKEYVRFKKKAILENKFSIRVQDEATFEITKKTNRMLMIS